MKKLLAFVVFCLVLSISGNGLCGDWVGNTNAFCGGKYLSKEHWDPVQNHSELGVDIDFKNEDWPVSIAFIFSETYAAKTSGYYTKHIARTTNLNLGARKVFDLGFARPFISGGVAWISAESEDKDTKYSGVQRGEPAAQTRPFDQNYKSDANYGFWVDAGILTPVIRESFNIGLAWRYSKAQLKDFGEDASTAASHISFIAGITW